jgi:elongation factor G
MPHPILAWQLTVIQDYTERTMLLRYLSSLCCILFVRSSLTTNISVRGMIRGWSYLTCICRCSSARTSRSTLSAACYRQIPGGFHRPISSTRRNTQGTSLIRNIGIIAHIDAGKTTTTERMLFYSGHTRRIGDVDEGSTVTDFLPAERARGITIQSAAITFDWPPQHDTGLASSTGVNRAVHHINLIDTPGHADFTFEVRRSIRVLDGAVCILDGVAGVEAQTEQVWNQASEWKIPRLIFVNKLDRDGAAFGRAVREIGSRLGVWPALCQIPWFEGGKGRFTGVGDVIRLQALKYDPESDGTIVKMLSLAELRSVEPHLADELQRARVALVELLSEHDDSLVEAFFDANEDHLALEPHVLVQSLRSCLLQERSPIVPVFAGASFRNIGVQPLLDAVNDLLPAPEERPDPDVSIGAASGTLSQVLSGELMAEASQHASAKAKEQNKSVLPTTAKQLSGCALAFKVVNDPRRGVLVYIRVYSGSIRRNDVLYNTNLQISERATGLLRMYASDSEPVDSIEAGQIGVIAGSKTARTGDTLVSFVGHKQSPPELLNQLQLRPIHVPPPVFFAAIEPNSLREERDMHEKLGYLLREDPSLSVSQDADTGQTLLSGMGELHLEIARDRLVSDLKAKAHMGPITIGYRETLMAASKPTTRIFDSDKSGSKGKAGCTVTVCPVDESSSETSSANTVIHEQDGNTIIVDAPSLDKKGRPLDAEAVALSGHLTLKEIQTAYINGALAAVSRGPGYSYPLRNIQVKLTLDPVEHIFGPETTAAALSAAARVATVAAFRDSAAKNQPTLLEPVMHVFISVDDVSLGKIVQDISSARGGHIVSLGDDETEKAVEDATTKVDVSRIYAPRDPFESMTSTAGAGAGDLQAVNIQRTVEAKVPLKEMVGYLKHLRSMTGGRGTFVMSVDRFERVTGMREKMLIQELKGLS